MPRPSIDKAAFGFWHAIPTRWSDLDLLGHVNNTRFYTFDEDVRLAYFESLWRDDPDFWKTHGFILARLECDFIAQLRHPATVNAGFRITRLGGSSFGTQAAMFEGERLVAVTQGVLVWFDYARQKPMAIPEPFRAAIRAREPVAPEEG